MAMGRERGREGGVEKRKIDICCHILAHTHYLLAEFKVQHVRVGDNGDSHIPLMSIKRIVL